MIAAVAGWLAGRSDRERRLLVLAALVAVGVLGGWAVVGVRDDLARLRARVAAHERELAVVRRLAGTLAATAVADERSLAGRLAAATADAGLADRVVAMTPASDPRGLALRVSGASLPEVVRLLHVLDREPPPLGLARLGLRSQPDDRRRFEVTLELAGGPTP